VTNLFREYNWARVINEGGDLHHANSDAIFGKENYTKETRKRAKACAFGMLYGQEAVGFQKKFPEMTMDEAREFIVKFKKVIPSITRGQDRLIKEAQRTGTFYTSFGRPRRVKHYLASHDYKDVAFGKRTCMNGPIQGTAADVLKLELVRLWDNIFTVYPEIKFICTIHDEINYSVPRRLASEVIPKLVRCQTVQMKDWLVPLDCSLSVGNSLGSIYPFKYNFETKEFVPEWEEDVGKKKDEPKQEDSEISESLPVEDIDEENEGNESNDFPVEEIDPKMFDF
jgi:DNA polymerase-1